MDLGLTLILLIVIGLIILVKLSSKQINTTVYLDAEDEWYLNSKVKVATIKGKGKGLVAKELIKKNEIVSISGGRIMKIEDWQALREEKGYEDYAFQIEKDFVISPLNPAKPGADWYMNHCCEPNVGIKGQITFVALRDIKAGEELTYDYCMSETNPDYSIKLKCNEKICRGKLTGNDWKDNKIQHKYKGYFSKYVSDLIKKRNEIKDNSI